MVTESEGRAKNSKKTIEGPTALRITTIATELEAQLDSRLIPEQPMS